MEKQGAAILCLSGLALGVFGVIATLLSSDKVSPYSQTFWRFTIAASIFLSVSAVLFGKRTIPGKRELVVMVVGGGIMEILSLTYTGAISLGLQVPSISFLSQMSAMFTVLFAVPLLRERLTATKTLAVSVGTAGVLMISQPWRSSVGDLAAESLIILNAVCFALFTIFNREFVSKRDYEPQLLSTWIFSGAALWSLPSLAFHAVQSPIGLAQNELGLLAAMAFLSTFVPYSLLNLGLKRVEAGEASVLLLLSPVSATTLSYVVLGEGTGLLTVLGAAFIVSGVVFLALTQGRIRMKRGEP